MSLVVVAAVALIAAGVMAWLVRGVLADIRDQRAQLLAALERMCDRVQAPGVAAAHEWQLPQATKSLTDADEEWLHSKESMVPWDEDLQLADTEMMEG